MIKLPVLITEKFCTISISGYPEAMDINSLYLDTVFNKLKDELSIEMEKIIEDYKLGKPHLYVISVIVHAQEKEDD
jgi:hypothetical protein